MKKTVTVLLILILSLALAAGCGVQDSPNEPVSENPAPDQPPAGQPAPPQPAPEETVSTGWSSGGFAAAYIDILTGGVCYIKCRTEADYQDQKVESIMETAMDSGNVAAITTTEGLGSVTAIIKDNTLHMVDHANKAVMVFPPGMGLNENMFPDSGYVFKSSGSADFFGEAQNYEEYSTAAGDVRFFFAGEKLIGFESGVGGLSVQMEILEISSTVPSGMFDIPKGYTLTDISDMQNMINMPDIIDDDE